MSFQNGHHLELSSVQTTLHVGAHLDAPSHYHPQGKSIDQCDLNLYLGACQVIDCSGAREGIGPEHLQAKSIKAPRVLFKTNSFEPQSVWRDDFAYLRPETVDLLAVHKVCLVGIDTPSMDHANSKDLLGHQAFYRHQMAILEGLVLKEVPEGVYQLVALPLKISGGEASPVRAILLAGESS